jgi:hypothetical protein
MPTVPYYLGRPADVWIAAMSPRRAATATAAKSPAVHPAPAAALAASGGPGHSAAGQVPATAARCVAPAAKVWAGEPGNGTAGATYHVFEFSNTWPRACTLHGCPGVSASGSSGDAIGVPATHAGPKLQVTIPADGTSHVVLGIVDSGAVCANLPAVLERIETVLDVVGDAEHPAVDDNAGLDSRQARQYAAALAPAASRSSGSAAPDSRTGRRDAPRSASPSEHDAGRTRAGRVHGPSAASRAGGS